MKAQADIAAVARHRIAVDGDGVNTLVVFMTCPLRCKYCLNPQTLDAGLPHRTLTPDELYEETGKDESAVQCCSACIAEASVPLGKTFLFSAGKFCFR